MSAGDDTRLSRITSVRAEMVSAGHDALLVSSHANIRYLSGFSGSSALLVVSLDRVVLITDFRYRSQAGAEVEPVAEVEIEGTSLWSRLWAMLPGMRDVSTVGFESQHVFHFDFQRLLDGGADWKWRPTMGVVESLRQRKDATEIALIRRAVGVAESALEATVPGIRAGLSELQVAAMLERALRERGSEAHPFETIVASGERSALPHARCTSRALRNGDLVLVDFGATVGGYCSDITRSFVIGKATQEQRDVYDVVREANATAASGVRAGMRGRDADQLARGYIERHGFGADFGHSLGHGIGLEVHEGPRLARTADAPLPTGSVITIEPGIYRDGWGGVRIEDDVLLEAGGPVLLTGYPRRLMELGAG